MPYYFSFSKYRKTLILSVIALALLTSIFILGLSSSKTTNNTTSVGVLPTIKANLNGEQLTLEVADTTAARTQGLSGRQTLVFGQGMLFVFPQTGRYGFWMKDMNFSLDILWLDSNYKVVASRTNLSPATYPTVFIPLEPAQFVLEVPAGFVDNFHVAPGDFLRVESN